MAKAPIAKVLQRLQRFGRGQGEGLEVTLVVDDRCTARPEITAKHKRPSDKFGAGDAFQGMNLPPCGNKVVPCPVGGWVLGARLVKKVSVPIDPHGGEVFGDTEQGTKAHLSILETKRIDRRREEVVENQGVLHVGFRFGGEVVIELFQLASFRKRSHPGKIHVENIWWLSGRHHGLQLREVLAAVSGVDALHLDVRVPLLKFHDGSLDNVILFLATPAGPVHKHQFNRFRVVRANDANRLSVAHPKKCQNDQNDRDHGQQETYAAQDLGKHRVLKPAMHSKKIIIGNHGHHHRSNGFFLCDLHFQ